MFRALAYSSGVVGLGVVLLYATTPQRDDLKVKLEKHHSKAIRDQERMGKTQMDYILANANSDRPIWDVRS
jgi:hypothetical protein